MGETARYTVQQEDTLYSVARHFDLGIVELLAANPDVDAWVPEEDTELVLPTMHVLPAAPHRGIVINLPELRLFYFSSPDVVMTFPIGIGMEGWRTPVGLAAIIDKRANPAWVPPESMRAQNPALPKMIPPGSDNPLGAYALYLNWQGYRIHGTNRPQGIGVRSSHGCIRLYPEDIEVLFKAVKEGTAVHIVDQPYKLGWKGDTLYLEVVPTQEQLDTIAEYESPLPASVEGVHKAVRQKAGGESDIDWYEVDNALMEHNGIPVVIAHRSRH